jgi:hypothetical protein
MATTDDTDVAADAHAADRLNDLGVTLHEAPGQALAGYEAEDFTVLVVATSGADNGRLHEAVAAAYQQVTLSLELRERDSR